MFPVVLHALWFMITSIQSNEIIRQCAAKISLENVFHGDVDASVQTLNDSVYCGESWKSIYKSYCAHVQKITKRTWDFDQSSIFAQIDAFVQRRL